MGESNFYNIFKKPDIVPYLFLAPYLLFFIVFLLYPTLKGIYISGFEWGIFGPKRVVGLQNYFDLFSEEIFRNSLYNTLLLALMYVPPVVIVSLVLATMLRGNLPGLYFFRTSFFLPIVINIATAAIAIRWILDPEIGLLNRILDLLNLPVQSWLSQGSWAMFVVSLVTIWMSSGFYIIIFLAGLDIIPKELYEAAVVDGANSLQNFIHITLPLMKPVILLVSTLALITILQAFGQIYMLTQGGPYGSTRVLTYLLFEEGFSRFNFGRAASIGVIITVLIASITFVQFKLFSEK